MCVIEESHRGADRSPSSCARKDELRPGYYSRVRIVRHGGDADEMVKPGEAGELIEAFPGISIVPMRPLKNSATAGISPATFA